jgi:hypothetical protein
MNSGWLDILNKVKTGELSVDQAAVQMEALDNAQAPAAVQMESLDNGQAPAVLPAATPAGSAPQGAALQAEEDFQPEIGWWRHAWLVPLWIGILILVPSALLLNWSISNERFFWFYCSWLPLLLGLLVLVVGAWSRQARWAHVRVQPADGPHISISVPLPLQLAGWFMRIFGSQIKGLSKAKMSGADVAHIIEALKECKEPISVEVDEKDGDRVRVYVM